ncbi:hypothetical protein [Ferruginivarius sediminum]|uniref:Uncharacterized protein n=1 Tax=Ferruginivarius sediminum TaxID=2661937 RepID=A0A369T9B4_9PROT|nr:hypothetical protein [Ferruginivarius sediminum]RDD61462.1 hypothetical protein DRB17_13385 [Ferruginivarius sediminum]
MMTAEQPAIVRTFRVGKRTVTLSVETPRRGEVANMICEWSPDRPRRLSRKEWREYRRGRDAALADLAEAMGATVGVMEL